MLFYQRAALLLIGYFLLAEFGMWLAVPPIYTAPVWPATGLALFCLLLWGLRYGPVVWLAAFASDLFHKIVIAGHVLDTSILALTSITAIGSMLTALVGARGMALLVTDKPGSVSEWRVMRALLLAAPLAASLSATIGIGSMYFLQSLPPDSLTGNWLTWWMSECLGILMVTPIMLPLAYRQHDGLKDHARRLQWLPLLFIVLVVMVFHTLGKSEQLEFRQRFASYSELVHEHFERGLFALSDSVNGVAAFMNSSEEVNLDEFKRFAQHSLKTRGIEGLGWAPLVPIEQRNEFEAQAKHLRQTAFSIADNDGQGNLVPAGERSYYYPFLFISIRNGHTIAAGYDLGSEDPDQLAMAIRSGRAVLLERRAFYEENPNRPDDWRYLLPVYRTGFDSSGANEAAREEAFIGFAVGLIYFNDLLADLAQRVESIGVSFCITLSALDGGSPVQLMDTRLPIHLEQEPDWSNHPEFLADKRLDIKSWSVAPWQPAQSTIMQVFIVAIVVLMLLLTAYAIITAGHNMRIAERVKRRTLALKKTKQELADILNNMASYIVELDRGGFIVRMNKALLDAYGQPESRLIGRHFTLSPWFDDLPEEQQALSGDFQHALQGNRVRRDVQLRRQNGELFTLDLNIIPISNNESTIDKLIVSAIDITERKTTEEQLKNNKKLLNRVIEGSELGYWDWNLATNQLVVKGHYGRMLGYDNGQFINGEDFFRLLHPEDKLRVRQLFDQYYRRQSDYFLAECRLLSASGNWHWIRSRGKIVQYDGAGQAMTMAGVNVDIHQEKLIEIELHDSKAQLVALNQSLEELVESRTRELQLLAEQLEHRVTERTKQLEQARQDAEQANQSKSYFLATMSHEIRTPLNGVVGMLDVLARTELTRSQHDMLNLIHYSAVSLSELINAILEFSKIESGKLDLEKQPLSIPAVVEQTCQMLDQQARILGAELTLFIDPVLPGRVLGDSLRIRQILINLVGNAIKFSGSSRPGKVSVRTSLSASGVSSIRIQFDVADNGIGIDPAVQSTLFDAFTQADSSTTRRFGGTGLGLTITHHLVQLLGGDIKLQSEPGAGSCFTVSLPFELDDDNTDSTVSASVLDGLSCLVIGGNEGIAEDLLCYLQHENAQVHYAADIEAAARMSECYPPGMCIWVYDATRQQFPTEQLRTAASSWPDRQVRFVTLERGARRHARQVAADHVMMDANVLKRAAFLDAVAGAAGYIRLPERYYATEKVVRAGREPLTGRHEASILVAEDNEVNQKVIRQQLLLLGYTADIANNGVEAIELWRKKPYDLLITDLHMPEMDGYQLTRQIREQENGASPMSIVALSANAFKEEIARCLEQGMNDYLSKPMELQKLKAMLERWLPEHEDESPPVAGTETDPTEAVDISRLKALIGDDESIFQELLTDYLQSLKENQVSMADAWKQRDMKRLGDIAHTLKSSSRSVGAITLGDCCDQIEVACHGARPAMTPEMLQAFYAEAERVIGFIEKRIKE
ncbi:ATP-binding protein [uncultured Oceanisphaera sp.]|uniref:ATP-binding protein n=1 Tax=uncultured Oceanisphaera sp. TaxID=353858 RepID=UPI002621B69C|nr:ATP-binding protein [uncultured Oceanisphaera sp.]